MAIYVKFAEENRPKTINEFLLLFYTQKQYYDQACAADTYIDKECGKLQCSKPRRSFDDLLELVKTYYPSTTAKILIGKLLKLKIPNYETCYLTNCSEMRKIRISYYTNNKHPTIYDNLITTRKFDSKYSWIELLSMININSQKELDNYIK